jgi:type II secretory ATPase GspE/PulE/Tfp pilus assembly ATPase PilB-like protein
MVHLALVPSTSGSAHMLWILATAPPLGQYANPVKLAVMLVLIGVWLALCQWVDRDTDKVKADHDRWLTIIFGAGVAGFILGVLLPWSGFLFAVGLPLYAGPVAIAGALYLKHRNALVAAEAQVSLGSVLRVMLGWFTGKEVKNEVTEQIRIYDSERKQVSVPKSNEEQVAYAEAQNLIMDAVNRRASDVDLMPSGEQVRVAYRIDGVVTEGDMLDRQTIEPAMLYIKRIAGLEVEERRRPQLGKIEATRGLSGPSAAKRVTIEVRTSGSTAGERMMFRILSEETSFRLPDLGLTQQQQEQLEAAVAEPGGLIIVSGPKGSGVTTTLYAFLRGCDAFTQNIHTLELNPAMDLENVTQNVYEGQQEGITFSRKLQSVLRRDPDILMVSDCPDKETARLLTASSADRKRVLLGMPGESCITVLRKFMTMVGDPESVAKSLRAISCQRLVRILCENCREAYAPDAEMLRKANLPADRIDKFYKAVGTLPPEKEGRPPVICPICTGTGYVGRTGVFEVLIVNDEIRQAMAKGDLGRVKAIARKGKPPMLYLQEEGLRKVMAGTTSMKEFLRAIAPDQGG